MHMSTHCIHNELRGTKQHAQIVGQSNRLRPYWVYDDEDWVIIKDLTGGQLRCPVEGCSAKFQKPIQRQDTRYLAHMPNLLCQHQLTRPQGGGGKISKEHRWLQARLARICESIGYTAITEHKATNSDVFVEEVNYAIEVQRWSTKFVKRTQDRLSKGSPVIWLFPEDANTPAIKKALFNLPAARLIVVCHSRCSIKLEPWNNQNDNQYAILRVLATVATLDRNRGKLHTHVYDAKQFLKEVFSGDRTWFSRQQTLKLPFMRGGQSCDCNQGLWITKQDMAALQMHENCHAFAIDNKETQPLADELADITLELHSQILPQSSKIPSQDVASLDKEVVVPTDIMDVAINRDTKHCLEQTPRAVHARIRQRCWWRRLLDFLFRWDRV